MPTTADVSDLSVDLTGRVVAVTGAASGIGDAVARYVHAQGATVVALDVQTEACEALVADLGSRAHAVRCDVTDRGSVAAAAQAADAATGGVDVLVNCAGVVRLAPAEDLDPSDWQLTLDVNLTGTFTACQEFGRGMLERGHGRIVNLASQAATVALPDHLAYCASKFGVLGLTKVLASEWGPRGITVNSLSPTVVLTPLGRAAWDNEKGEALKAQIPVERFAEPEEIAAAAAFLASRAAGMINGADLLVDGGYTIR